MDSIAFILYNKLITNYLTREKFKHSPRDSAILSLFRRSELKDLSQLLEEYHRSGVTNRSEVLCELNYAMATFLSRYGIFNIDTLVCSVSRTDHIQYIKLSVYVECNDDTRALNVLKLKNPELYTQMREELIR